MTRKASLRDFEALEDRSLPSTFGVPWADPTHLTLSFAPDGTATPLGPNSLSQTLASSGSTPVWERAILRAFQTWASQANINIGLVVDGGQAMGSLGAVQGDSRFGDIRVASAPLSPGVVASASPFSWTGTTFSGDVMLNALQKFVQGDQTGAYDLFSVALHEAGHTFGLDHSDVAGSAMNEDYHFVTSLTASDIAALQALYGVRTQDSFDIGTNNNVLSRADAIPQVSGSSQLLAAADLTTQSDVDFYKFNAPALTSWLSAVVVRLKASGISLLTSSITVYNSSGHVVGSAVSNDPLNNDLMVQFRPGLLGGTYYVKVAGAGNGVFDVGGYKLAVDFLSVGGLLAPITNTVGAVLDGHTNDLLSTALGLPSQTKSDSRFDAIYRGVIEDSSDVDTYRISTGKFAAGTLVTLNAVVWGLDSDPLDPRIRVYDSAGHPVAFQVLANDRGIFSLQVPNAVACQSYYIQVAARSPGGANDTGSYFMGADFNSITPLLFEGVTSGSTFQDTTTTGTLTIQNAGIFHFALDANAEAGTTGTLTMTVVDQFGNSVFSLSAALGQPDVTATRYLRAGTYTIRYSTSSGSAVNPVRFNLFMLQLSDGVGPYATSTSTTSSGTSGSGGTSGGSSSGGSYYTYSGSSTSQPSGYGYTF